MALSELSKFVDYVKHFDQHGFRRDEWVASEMNRIQQKLVEEIKASQKQQWTRASESVNHIKNNYIALTNSITKAFQQANSADRFDIVREALSDETRLCSLFPLPKKLVRPTPDLESETKQPPRLVLPQSPLRQSRSPANDAFVWHTTVLQSPLQQSRVPLNDAFELPPSAHQSYCKSPGRVCASEFKASEPTPPSEAGEIPKPFAFTSDAKPSAFSKPSAFTSDVKSRTPVFSDEDIELLRTGSVEVDLHELEGSAPLLIPMEMFATETALRAYGFEFDEELTCAWVDRDYDFDIAVKNFKDRHALAWILRSISIFLPELAQIVRSAIQKLCTEHDVCKGALVAWLA